LVSRLRLQWRLELIKLFKRGPHTTSFSSRAHGLLIQI
jgi:hypothetical protein